MTGETEQELRAAGQELIKWMGERITKLAHAHHLEKNGHEGLVAAEVEKLSDAMMNGHLASYRDQFADRPTVPTSERWG